MAAEERDGLERFFTAGGTPVAHREAEQRARDRLGRQLAEAASHKDPSTDPIALVRALRDTPSPLDTGYVDARYILQFSEAIIAPMIQEIHAPSQVVWGDGQTRPVHMDSTAKRRVQEHMDAIRQDPVRNLPQHFHNAYQYHNVMDVVFPQPEVEHPRARESRMLRNAAILLGQHLFGDEQWNLVANFKRNNPGK